jgi:hypothetical protein
MKNWKNQNNKNFIPSNFNEKYLATLDMWENTEGTQRLEQLKFLLNLERNKALDEVENMINSFIRKSDDEQKDNYLWYKYNLNNLLEIIKELREK